MEIIDLNVIEKNEKLRNLKKLATDKGIARRIDDEFLGRFLIGHQYDIRNALKALCNYESFIDRRSETWLKWNKSRLETILESQVIDVLDKTGFNNQKIVWIKLANWDPVLFPADDILEVSGLLCELAYAVKRDTIKNVDIIIDLHNISLKHLYALSPRFAKRMVFFISDCLPMKLCNIYIIRQPKIFYLLYAVFTPFIEEKMRKLIHICGHNYKPLLDNIGPDTLPLELDGNSGNLLARRWLNVINNAKVIKELTNFGYEFFEDKIICQDASLRFL